MPEYPWDLVDAELATDDSDLIDEDPPQDAPFDQRMHHSATDLDALCDIVGDEARTREASDTMELLRAEYQSTRAGVLVDVMRKLERGEHRG